MTISDYKTLSSYISIDLSGRTSFGGSQTWYSLKDKKEDRYIHLYGCGLVAVSDFILYYLRSRRRELPFISGELITSTHPSQKVYMEYLRLMKRKGYPLFKYFGSFSLQALLFLGYFSRKNGLPLKFRYLLNNSSRNRLKVIRKALKAGLPVILLVGPALRKINGHKGITLYRRDEKGDLAPAYKNLHKHFVTITGILTPSEAGKSLYLEISSWGQQLYIDYEDLSLFIRKSGSPLLSTLIYATESEN